MENEQTTLRAEGSTPGESDTPGEGVNLLNTINSAFGFVPTTCAAVANVATSSLHLYQMPILRNTIKLGSDIINTIAYTYSSNFYLKITGGALIAGASYNQMFMLTAELLVSQLLFIQTPKIVDAYLPNNGISYFQKGYLLISLAKSLYELKENNYGRQHFQYEKTSQETWQNITKSISAYHYNAAEWLDNKTEQYQKAIDILNEKIEDYTLEDCITYWQVSVSDALYTDICAKGAKFDYCVRAENKHYKLKKAEEICSLTPEERQEFKKAQIDIAIKQTKTKMHDIKIIEADNNDDIEEEIATNKQQEIQVDNCTESDANCTGSTTNLFAEEGDVL